MLLTCYLLCVLYVRANAVWNIFALGVGQLLKEACVSFIDERLTGLLLKTSSKMSAFQRQTGKDSLVFSLMTVHI